MTGLDHRDISDDLSNFATVLSLQKEEESVTLWQRAHEIRVKALRPEHKQTLNTILHRDYEQLDAFIVAACFHEATFLGGPTRNRQPSVPNMESIASSETNPALKSRMNFLLRWVVTGSELKLYPFNHETGRPFMIIRLCGRTLVTSNSHQTHNAISRKIPSTTPLSPTRSTSQEMADYKCCEEARLAHRYLRGKRTWAWRRGLIIKCLHPNFTLCAQHRSDCSRKNTCML